MGKTTGISWTDATWNPWQGCTKVSDGCKNCYMYREKTRYGQDPFTVVRSKPHTFNAPLKWNLPERSRIFVCSWSDFFHKDADEWRNEAWGIIGALPQYDFLIPTKRIERVDGIVPSNVWLGVSVENQETADKRVPLLMATNATVKWVSAEPLLGPVYLPYQVDWVVVGGESGQNARPMDIEWARDLREECWVTATPYFLKQLGGWPNALHEMSDFPEDMRVREFPQ